MPRNGEHYTAIASVGHHNRRIAWQKRPIENEVDSLAGGNERRRLRIIEPANTVLESTSGIDDGMAKDVVPLPRFRIDANNACEETLCVVL